MLRLGPSCADDFGFRLWPGPPSNRYRGSTIEIVSSVPFRRAWPPTLNRCRSLCDARNSSPALRHQARLGHARRFSDARDHVMEPQVHLLQRVPPLRWLSYQRVRFFP
jgi:hypothetical protein